MIHEASCKIEVDLKNANINIMGVGAEPPIPSDEELLSVFPDWIARGKIFLGRIYQAEGKSGNDPVTPQQMFKYGMKFVICEAKKSAGIV